MRLWINATERRGSIFLRYDMRLLFRAIMSEMGERIIFAYVRVIFDEQNALIYGFI